MAQRAITELAGGSKSSGQKTEDRQETEETRHEALGTRHHRSTR